MRRENVRAIIAAVAAAAAAAATSLSACALLDDVGDAGARTIASYCKEPAKTRDLVRDAINARAAPNSLTITCATDKK